MLLIALDLRHLLLLFMAVPLLSVVVSSSVFAQEVVYWECRVEGSNDGCKKTIKAPSGKKIVGVTAACNLEYGAVSNSELASVPANTIKVVKKSDRRWFRPNGYCYVGNTKIYSGKKTIEGINGIKQVLVGCFEHDKNGGDCHIRGTLTLQDGNGATPKKKFTFTVQLQRQDIVQGNIPYTGRFPTIGQLPSGILKNVRSITGYPLLSFVKPGRSTEDCNQANAVVRLNPGNELSPANIKTLFGSKTPALPVYFNACAGASQQLYNWIPIKITYEKN
ncbi:MAG: hypothetical protein GY781_13340 [Gammaproteobacteria bacterium]|nr:hypothetical protein [Desulfobulbaceae bacterium]MCP4272923.1 hypothetical protein [Gammaproteobacteria bacterium]